jgi:IS5 family transposase
MHRFDGTAARQLDLIDLDTTAARPRVEHPVRELPRANVRLLRRDVYAELERRRRRAQIAARRWTDQD